MMRFKEKYNKKAYIISDDKRKIVSVSENGKVYKGNNERGQAITVYKVDGGIIKDGVNPKCDFAIYTNRTDNLYLIELKGRDYSHALEQILSSIEALLQPRSQVAVNCVYARIVLSRSPIPCIHEKELKKKLKELNGAYKEEYLKNASNKKLEEDIK